MHRLRFLRVPLGGGIGGIRPRAHSAPTAAASAGNTSRMAATSSSSIIGGNTTDTHSNSSSSSSSSSRCLSTSANQKKYEDIPKRVYESAPKRRHGKHAGMKKWSAATRGPPPQEAEQEQEEQEGEVQQKQLALGDVWSSGNEGDLREITTGLKEIRVSPWNLNLLAKLVRGLPVVEANAQLLFCKKKHTTTVAKAIQNALNLADMRYGLAAEELEVGEIFVTKGKVVKRLRIMGRGRAGIARRKWSHLNVTLREIDFDKQLKAAPSRNRREKLMARKDEVEQLRAERGEQVHAEPI
ncbi:unnamed protein product [Ectocarpus sp. 6 AP-2014]